MYIYIETYTIKTIKKMDKMVQINLFFLLKSNNRRKNRKFPKLYLFIFSNLGFSRLVIYYYDFSTILHEVYDSWVECSC